MIDITMSSRLGYRHSARKGFPVHVMKDAAYMYPWAVCVHGARQVAQASPPRSPRPACRRQLRALRGHAAFKKLIAALKPQYYR